jgi:hypothetical protein
MDRQAKTVDVNSILKPVFFVSKMLGLSPYSAVGDIGNRTIIVTVSAIIYSLGMFILNVGVLAYLILPTIFRKENICVSSEYILYLGTVCHSVSAYLTCVLGCRQTAQQFQRINDLIGKTYHSVWRKDLQLLLARQILCIITIVIAGALDSSVSISEFNYYTPVLVSMSYCLTEHAGFTADHKFFAFMHILKRTVQNWNSLIDAVSENRHVWNDPLYQNEMNRRKSILFIVSNNRVTSKHKKVHPKFMQFKHLRELHASACDIAETVNAIYSPMLLLSVTKLFASITHTVYYIIVNFIVKDTRLFCYTEGNNSYFLWLIHESLRLIWLVYFTALTAKELSHNV